MGIPKWISIQRYAGNQPYWHLVDFFFYDIGDPSNNMSTNAYVVAKNSDGSPSYNSKAVQRNGGETLLPPFHDYGGYLAQTDFPMTADSNFDPAKGEVGPYSAYMFGPSDKVSGLGLPLKQHVQYRLIFQWSDTPPPTPQLDWISLLRALIEFVTNLLKRN